MTQLYDLPETLRPLTDLEDDDFEPHLANLLADYTLSFYEGDLLKLGKVVKTLEASEDTLKAFAQDVQRRIDAVTGRIARLKSYMLNLATQAGIERVKDPLVHVYTQANPPSVEVNDEAAVPMKYKRAAVTLPYSQALELLPEDVLATASVSVMAREILNDVKQDGAVPDGVTVVNDRRHLRVR